jgi:hypothetical protein
MIANLQNQITQLHFDANGYRWFDGVSNNVHKALLHDTEQRKLGVVRNTDELLWEIDRHRDSGSLREVAQVPTQTYQQAALFYQLRVPDSGCASQDAGYVFHKLQAIFQTLRCPRVQFTASVPQSVQLSEQCAEQGACFVVYVHSDASSFVVLCLDQSCESVSESFFGNFPSRAVKDETMQSIDLPRVFDDGLALIQHPRDATIRVEDPIFESVRRPVPNGLFQHSRKGVKVIAMDNAGVGTPLLNEIGSPVAG